MILKHENASHKLSIEIKNENLETIANKIKTQGDT